MTSSLNRKAKLFVFFVYVYMIAFNGEYTKQLISEIQFFLSTWLV